jgi:hypothetical protein
MFRVLPYPLYYEVSLIDTGIVFDVNLSTIGNAIARTSQPMIFRILERISCSIVRNTGAIYTHAQKNKTK